MKSWNKYLFELAQHIATKSKDPSRQIGCVIVGPDREVRSTGFNGFPRGVRETAEGAQHLPESFERSLSGNEYFVLCSCGERITIPINKLDANVNGVFPACHSYNQVVDSVAKAHDHFQYQERVLSERWERPQKYQWVEHAERNAIYNAARMGIPLKGCTAYITLAPCADCTRALIQSGITTVYGTAFPEVEEYQDYGFDKSIIMMNEGGIKYYTVDHEKENTT